jgi:hypothetical protein
MTSFKAVFNGISAAAALASAGLWFGAAKIRILVWDDRQSAAKVSDARIIVDDIDFFATVAEQAKWNRWAALVTGIAAVCQALALVLPT